jgi:hypothetical protein
MVHNLCEEDGMSLGRWIPWSAALAALMLTGASALAQSKPACDPAKTPQMVSGQVVRVDTAQGKVTVRAADGTIHEFQASKETLADLKTGDRIEAKLRSC